MFDARAMVEANRTRIEASPAYGGMPSGTAESREAVERLRAEGSKKRRRNRVIRLTIFVLVFGSVAVAGYFAYRAFQADQEPDDTPQATTLADLAE